MHPRGRGRQIGGLPGFPAHHPRSVVSIPVPEDRLAEPEPAPREHVRWNGVFFCERSAVNPVSRIPQEPARL